MYYLSYRTFVQLYREAQEYSDLDMYIAERGWQDWMDSFEDADVVVDILTRIYEMVRCSFAEIRQMTGLSQVRFSYSYGIKRRTLESWEAGLRTPPEHDRYFFSYTVFLEIMNNDSGEQESL
ncbi:MAG: hypothetical protein Q4F24_08225 [Eubacteriales bacterium]|nr:hypothetical protein [Eubacteriales bacterium]